MFRVERIEKELDDDLLNQNHGDEGASEPDGGSYQNKYENDSDSLNNEEEEVLADDQM